MSGRMSGPGRSRDFFSEFFIGKIPGVFFEGEYPERIVRDGCIAINTTNRLKGNNFLTCESKM